MNRFFRSGVLGALLWAMLTLTAPRVWAQNSAAPVQGQSGGAVASATETESGGEASGHATSEKAEGPRPVFEPEHGTWFNYPARHFIAPLFESEQEKADRLTGESPAPGKEAHYVAKYDFLLYTPLLWGLLALLLVGAARKAKIRPEGKPASSANLVEAAVAAFQDYLIGVMGNDLARKYTPLIASFFFTILVSNWLGLIPGMLAASAQPAIPISLAIVAFVSVHVIAIKETGLKSWFMHFVGEPLWLAPLNFPLHLVGELIKPLSLSLRLLCNVFGEEAVVATLVGLALAFLPAWLPIPFQLPMLFLGTFFGFLQALVFSTLLSIYISIFATHHEDGHGHPSTEHATDLNGKHVLVGHPAEAIVG